MDNSEERLLYIRYLFRKGSLFDRGTIQEIRDRFSCSESDIRFDLRQIRQELITGKRRDSNAR